MGSNNLKDVLTDFSPALDFFAICSGDGRIKIWDTLKGQIQSDLVDIVSNEETNLYSKSERGHLSIDYTCMKWLTLDRKKKRKIASSLIILGTGSGDVLALDVSAGQLKWKASDCHPGGVSAISCATNGSCTYTAGADGMICKLDSLTGNMLGKFKASTKAISSMSVSSDGKQLATAAGQLKIFNLPNNKKRQKFSGHPGAVRCLIFTEDSKYVLSSAVGERYIAIWRSDGSKEKSASCVLAMDHPAIFLDSKWVDNDGGDNAGLYVLAISEIGVCYFWYGQNIEDLRNSKPTKVSVSAQDISKNNKGIVPAIVGARLQGISKPASGHLFLAYGLLVKPSFQKLLVHFGTDVKLDSLSSAALLPKNQSLSKLKKPQNAVTALDRSNAEDALLPVPKISSFQKRETKHQSLSLDADEVMADLANSRSHDKQMKSEDNVEVAVVDEVSSIEDRLKSLGILGNGDDLSSDSRYDPTLKDINLEANLPQKKMKAAVLSRAPTDAYKLLGVLMDMWTSRTNCGKYVLPWIYIILANYSPHVISQDSVTKVLDSLYRMSKARGATVQPLLQLSGCMQLVMAQIDKASKTQSSMPYHPTDDSEDEDDSEDILYGEEDDDSQISDDADDDQVPS